LTNTNKYYIRKSKKRGYQLLKVLTTIKRYVVFFYDVGRYIGHFDNSMV